MLQPLFSNLERGLRLQRFLVKKTSIFQIICLTHLDNKEQTFSKVNNNKFYGYPNSGSWCQWTKVRRIWERARATYSKIINRLHIFSRLFIYIESVVVEVIKNFDYYFLRCNPSYWSITLMTKKYYCFLINYRLLKRISLTGSNKVKTDRTYASDYSNLK